MAVRSHGKPGFCGGIFVSVRSLCFLQSIIVVLNQRHRIHGSRKLKRSVCSGSYRCISYRIRCICGRLAYSKVFQTKRCSCKQIFRICLICFFERYRDGFVIHGKSIFGSRSNRLLSIYISNRNGITRIRIISRSCIKLHISCFVHVEFDSSGIQNIAVRGFCLRNRVKKFRLLCIGGCNPALRISFSKGRNLFIFRWIVLKLSGDGKPGSGKITSGKRFFRQGKPDFLILHLNRTLSVIILGKYLIVDRDRIILSKGKGNISRFLISVWNRNLCQGIRSRHKSDDFSGIIVRHLNSFSVLCYGACDFAVRTHGPCGNRIIL